MLAFRTYNPWSEMRRLHQAMDSLLAQPNLNFSVADAQWNPSFDVKESDTHLTVHADLPGVKKEDIHINFEKGVLTIQGSRSSETKTDKEHYHTLERQWGSFSRSIRLPSGVDASLIEAVHQDGVLELSIPKPTPQQDTTRIEIRSRTPICEAPSSECTSTSTSTSE